MSRVLPAALLLAVGACAPVVRDAEADPASRELAAPEMTAMTTTAKQPGSPTIIDPSEGAQGRRTLSTAFVRVGPDGRLTVGAADGRTLLLDQVSLQPDQWCGRLLAEQAPGMGACRTHNAKHCLPYAEVRTARPGDGGWTFDVAGACLGGPNLEFD